MKRLLLIIVLAFLLPSLAPAQTINAAGCSESQVAAALASVNQAAAVVNIPACAATGWSTTLSYSVPSNNSSLTIQGRTTCTGSGDPAQNNLACTDGTILVDNTSQTGFMDITTNGSTSSFVKITGITFNSGSDNLGFNGPNGEVRVEGSSQNVRIDHNHFNMAASGGSWTGAVIGVNGCVYGVIDHNKFDDQVSANNGVIFGNGSVCPADSGDTGENDLGDGVWHAATQFGSNQFMFVEQNSFSETLGAGNVGMMNDCDNGGKWVWRFNSSVNGHIQTHPTAPGRRRGCRAMEVYGNNATSSGGVQAIATFMYFSSGPGLFWGNTLTESTGIWGSLIAMRNCRQNNVCGYGPGAPPASWGWCGTNGGPSGWDGNSNSAGHPCIDQTGRGQGDLLSGAFPNTCNITLNPACNVFTGQWPRQMLEPAYMWLNSFNGATTAVDNCCANATQNTDYFISSNPNSGANCNGFTGATGVGCGALSSRPATCTAGPGGTYGTSPTGSYGVAYWATDQGSWNTSGNGAGNGVLYVCTATNNWTSVYTPYTYPHPLTTTGSGSPAAPKNLQAVVN